MNMRSLNDFWVYDCLIGLGIRISPPADQAYDSIFDIRRQEAKLPKSIYRENKLS